MAIKVRKGKQPWCPKCGAGEMHPFRELLLIRAYKVYDDEGAWSQCLVCAGAYDEDLNPLDKTKEELTGGWFVE